MSWSFPRTPSCAHTSAFPRDFLFPTTTPRRSTAAALARHCQPPTPPPNHDLVLLEHHRNSLQLTDPPNFPFPHPSVVPRSTGELELRRCSASPSMTPFRPTSCQTRYGNSIPTTPRCSCALHPSMFAGPSSGTQTCRHGRRHSSLSTLLRLFPLCTPPTGMCPPSCRSYRTSFPSAKPSPPARTRRSGTTAAVSTRQGPNCNLSLCIRVLCARTRGPLCKFLN
jgi:hypothetical protein